MTIPVSLSNAYGAAFPDCTEIDHLNALRGYLILLKRQPDRDPHRVQAAIDEVTRRLVDDLGVDVDRLRKAPNELFGLYYDIVSRQARWLYQIAFGR